MNWTTLSLSHGAQRLVLEERNGHENAVDDHRHDADQHHAYLQMEVKYEFRFLQRARLLILILHHQHDDGRSSGDPLVTLARRETRLSHL